MLRDQEMVCDRCQKVITRVTNAPAEGWKQMHNLCSDCFLEVWKKSPARV